MFSARYQYKQFVEFLLVALLLSIFFDPADLALGLKKELFFASLASLLPYLYSRRRILPFELFVVVFLLLLFSVYGLFLGVYFDGEYSLSVALYLTFVFFPIISLPLIIISGVDYECWFARCGLLLGLVIIFLGCVFLFFPKAMDGILIYLNSEVQATKIGFREYGSAVFPMIYYKTSVLLVFTAAYYARKQSLSGIVVALVVLGALFFTGTRANIIVSLALSGVFIAIFLAYSRFKNFKLLVFPVFCFVSLALILVFFYIFGSGFFSFQEQSNSIKLGHYDSYRALFSENPVSFIFGFGFGSGFYSEGVKSLVFITELTFFEIIRYLGVFGGSAFLFVIFYPLVLARKLGVHYFCAWFCYLLIASTNPLLLSSTGCYALIFIYFVIYKPRRGVGDFKMYGFKDCLST